MNRIIVLTSLILAVLVQLSCKRNTDNVGPDICPSDAFVYNNFSFKDNSGNTTSVNLNTSFAKVIMTFSESIDYKIVISAPSGAQFVYSGKGSAINYNWYGNSTNGIYFQKNDVLTCTITNLCYPEPLGSGMLTLNSTISYNVGNWMKGTNFEDGQSYGVYPNGNIPGIVFTQTLPAPGDADYIGSPQGGSYLKVVTTSPVLTWYFGEIGLTGITSFAALNSDPANVYINFFARGQANSQAQFILVENVYGASLKRKFLANVGTDWKLYSVKLSDIGIINPSKIATAAIDIGAASHQDTSAEVEVDLVIFTFGSHL